MKELKPALSYDEQIQRLITVHNLTIPDRNIAMSILKKVNYYRLSGYGIGLFQKSDKEKYIDGTTLEKIYQIYLFDSELKSLLLSLIEHIEIQFRAQISNHLAISYGPEGYMDPANFEQITSKTGEVIHTALIDKFHNECERQATIPFVKHHMEKYDGHFPIWVAIELFTFGNLTSLYTIMHKEDQKCIADLYHTEPDHLKSWMLALVEIRNICAHYSRLYNLPLKQTPFLYKEDKIYRKKGKTKLFPVILSIRRLLSDNKDLWNVFYQKLCSLIDSNKEWIYLSFMDFPKDWKNVLSNTITIQIDPLTYQFIVKQSKKDNISISQYIENQFTSKT